MQRNNLSHYIFFFAFFMFAHLTTFSQTENVNLDVLLKEVNLEIRKDSVNPFFYKARGDIYILQDKYDLAASDFTKAISIYPDYYEAFVSRGLAYHKSGKLSKALDDFSFVIKKGESLNADIYYNRGVVFQDMKNYTEAISDYKACLKRSPDYDKAYYNLGIICLEQEDNEKAVEMFNKSLSINPDDVLSFVNRGYAKFKLTHYSDALNDFSHASKLDSSNYYVLKWIGLCYLKLNEPTLGNEYLEKAKKHGIDTTDDTFYKN